MAEFENVQQLLDEFKANVINEARNNLKSGLNRKYPIDASGKLSKSLKRQMLKNLKTVYN